MSSKKGIYILIAVTFLVIDHDNFIYFHDRTGDTFRLVYLFKCLSQEKILTHSQVWIHVQYFLLADKEKFLWLQSEKERAPSHLHYCILSIVFTVTHRAYNRFGLGWWMDAILNSQKPVTFIEQNHCGFTFTIVLKLRKNRALDGI